MIERAALIALLAGAGCSSGDPAASGGDRITIGGLLSQTGEQDDGGEGLKAVQLAMDEINANGGVLGRRLALLNKDDRSTTEGAAEAARALVAEKVPAAVGNIASALTLASAEITSAAGIVQITHSSTSPTLTATHATTTALLFRTCASDALQGKLLAKRAKERGFTKLAVINVPGAYGKGLGDVLSREFTALGGTITDMIEYVEGQQSYADVLRKVFEKDPQGIVLVAYVDDGAQFIKDYNALFSARQAFFYFTDGVWSDSFVTLAGDASAFRFQHEGTGPAAPLSPEYEAFKTSFTAKYGKPGNAAYFPQNAYDAVYLIAAAMEAAGQPTGFAAKLGSVSSGGMKFGPGQWKELAAAIKAGADVDYQGASGNVDLDASGDVVAPYDIWKVNEEGKIEIVAQSVSP
jgi:ABC-type branched-subunit amino acid transport system substrate-binding protein